MADHHEPVVWRSIRFLLPARTVRSLQANLSREEPGILASYALIGAVLVFGALGYMLDRFVDTAPWCLFIGLLVGISVGFYNLVQTARRR
jgi:F0F1-type ATP synthase assembly protein I